MSSYKTGQEIMFQAQLSTKWRRGKVHSAWGPEGWWRILPECERGVIITELAPDGTRVTVCSCADMRPVSPLILLAECVDE